MNSCLVEIKVGDKIKEKGDNGRVGILKDIKLVPNGMNCPELVTVLFVYVKEQDKLISATSENWEVIDDQKYDEFYPSVHLSHLSDSILAQEIS